MGHLPRTTRNLHLTSDSPALTTARPRHPQGFPDPHTAIPSTRSMDVHVPERGSPDPLSTVSDSNHPEPEVEPMDVNPHTEKPVSVHTSVASGPTVTVLSPNNCFSFLKHDSVLRKQGVRGNWRWAERKYLSSHPGHYGRPWIHQRGVVFSERMRDFNSVPRIQGQGEGRWERAGQTGMWLFSGHRRSFRTAQSKGKKGGERQG